MCPRCEAPRALALIPTNCERATDMSIPTITRPTIQEHTAGGSFERGEEYLANGAVQSVQQVGEHTVKAQVQGHDVHPYLVTLQFDDDSVTDVQCTCPYHGGSWCKHAVAVLLKILNADAVPKAEPAAVSDLVDDLDREAIVGLLERLAESHPEIVSEIEREAARATRS